MLVPVILCGGTGTRLWPISRKAIPKQFLNLIKEDESLFQTTLSRLKKSSLNCEKPIIVTSEQHRFLVAEQLEEIDTQANQILLEPVSKGTAPAIAIAALAALKKNSGSKLLIQTADHVLSDEDYFCKIMEKAFFSGEPLVTFGIKPTRPETGFGYIKLGPEIKQTNVFSVEKFVEKPNLQTASAFIENKDYLWNSGIYLIEAKTFIEELNNTNPELVANCARALELSTTDLVFTRIDKKAFSKCQSISVDYALMEKSAKLSVIKYDSVWSDIGSWDAMLREMKPNKNGNVIKGQSLAKNTYNTMIYSSQRLVVALGVKDLIIAETPDAILVSDKRSAQGVKAVVDELQKMSRIEATEHHLTHRPWGNFTSITKDDGYQVKKITVKPGKSLSLQSHKHRSEHWVVVRGTANVTNGEGEFMLQKNESTYISANTKHRLSNPFKEDLILIEVQTGDYLGEDDIIRFEDEFGRK